MNVFLTVGVLVLVGLWCAASYTRLIRLRQRVRAEWRQLDAQLKRRHDLVATLAAAVRDGTAVESGPLEAVIEARERAVQARGPAEAGRREGELSVAIGRFGAQVEACPEPGAVARVPALLLQLAETETGIARALAAYNDTANRYNTAREALPGSLVAAMAGFKRAEVFGWTVPGQAAVPPPGSARPT